MKNSPLHLAGCVVRNKKGEILLLHRNKNGVQQWELPGGKLESNEDPQPAAIRELQEELGVTVDIRAHLGEAMFIEKERECFYVWYEGVLTDGQQPAICEPQTFDDLRYWDVRLLGLRSDISANLENLLKSGVL